MNSDKIFELALGLQAPWHVSKVEMIPDGNKQSIHLHIDYDLGHFINSEGKSTVHDRVDRKWRHLNFFQHECYLHCRVPRIRENKESKVKQVQVPWSRKGSGFTLLFEAFSMALIELEMPVNKVGKLLGEYPNRIWTIFNYWLSIAYKKADHKGITRLGIDETSTKKGHKYMTVAVDMDERKVVHATTGKGSEAITQVADYLKSKGTPKESIQGVCIDLSPAFISGVTNEFENAQIVFDRYHVKALLNKAMDQVRRNELSFHQILKGHKYLFLKNEKNLKADKKELRNKLLELLPVIGKAYQLKVLFDDFWDMKNSEDAQAFLSFWCDLVQEAKIFPMIKFANTVKAHWSGIVNYTNSNLSNGILEGINSKIQLAKRRARGYRNTENFINMVYFIAGKLKFNYPLYST